MQIENPFVSPDQAHKNAMPAMLKMAEAVNAELNNGGRTVTIPAGLAKGVKKALAAKGWAVDILPKGSPMGNGQQSPPGSATLVFDCPQDHEIGEEDEADERQNSDS